MIKKIKQLLNKKWRFISVSSFTEENFIDLLHQRVDNLSHADALRYLFNMDRKLYILESQKASEYEGGIHPKHRLMRYHDFFVNKIQSNEQVLDIGCGFGAVAFDVADKSGASVVGIDLNEEYINIAKTNYKHLRVRYILGNVLDVLPEEQFDVVILSNVLEHLPDRSKFLWKVQQAVNPKRFLILVPLFERDWRVPLKKELGVEWRLDLTHEIEYTLENFTNELSAAGLKITYQEIRWGEIWAEAIPADPKISVVMAVRNGEKYLSQAIESLLDQTFPAFEFIIIDDASDDHTSDILEAFKEKDKRIILIDNKTHLGLARSLNIGISQARGTYIARMDSDDICLPHRLQTQFEYLEEHPEIGVLGSAVHIIDDAGSVTTENLQFPTDHDMIRWNFYLIINSIPHPSVMLRKDIFLKVMGYKEDLTTSQDYDLWIRLSDLTRLANLSQPLVYLRKHDTNISVSRSEEQGSNAFRIASPIIHELFGDDVSQDMVICLLKYSMFPGQLNPEAMSIAKSYVKMLREKFIYDPKLSNEGRKRIDEDVYTRLRYHLSLQKNIMIINNQIV